MQANVDPFGVSSVPLPTCGALRRVGEPRRAAGWRSTSSTCRLLHALVGLLTIAFAYALFRQCCLAGGRSSPPLFSRRQPLLLHDQPARDAGEHRGPRRGRRRSRCSLGTSEPPRSGDVPGGFVAGLGFYVYCPDGSRSPSGSFFLHRCWRSSTRRFPLRKLAAAGSDRTGRIRPHGRPDRDRRVEDPVRETTPQRDVLDDLPGSAGAAAGVGVRDERVGGYKTNISHGLGTFNSTSLDNAWIYENRGPRLRRSADGHPRSGSVSGSSAWH